MNQPVLMTKDQCVWKEDVQKASFASYEENMQ